MILYQYLVIHASFVFFVIIKVFCKIFEKHRSLMHDKHLKSISENNETEEEIVKWVPKKKHEILKAKYKCLKKLFQIYDASVIGILPETVIQDPLPQEVCHRRKRSYRTNTDAAAETSELSSGDVTQSENEVTIATAVIKELKLNVSTPNLEKSKAESKDDKCIQESRENLSIIIEKNCELRSNVQPFQVQRNQKRKPTRFQSFIHRLLGINTESLDCLRCDSKCYAASDNNISNVYEKRRRNGLRLRRIKRVKKIHSEIILGDTQSPMILSYVQTVQKSCLLDTTPRQCPIPGCKMIFNGIINYNDHLNLYHFPEKKFICNYCHDGFYSEHDKIVHENEHIGITKLSTNTPISTDTREPSKITNTNNTQTEADNSIPKVEVPDEKLKKIVSFFEKIHDTDEIIAEIKKSRCSESNLKKTKNVPTDETPEKERDCPKISNKGISSCVNIKQKSLIKCTSSAESDVTSRTSCGSFECRMCGEHFDYRRQLRLHVDMEHRLRNKFPKFHSCAGILNTTSESEEKRLTTMTSSIESDCSKISHNDIRREPSTNIVYYTSTETISKKPSVIDNFVHKVRTGFSYKWEPETKIIRV